MHPPLLDSALPRAGKVAARSSYRYLVAWESFGWGGGRSGAGRGQEGKDLSNNHTHCILFHLLGFLSSDTIASIGPRRPIGDHAAYQEVSQSYYYE